MEQCGSTNDGEAQRLKQELNALKFNTMEVDVKCRFLRGASATPPRRYARVSSCARSLADVPVCDRRRASQPSRRADHCRQQETTRR
jgi:hypothetical protein